MIQCPLIKQQISRQTIMTQETIIIGISGASGSGKSLLAHTIVDELGADKVTVLSEDAYYKHNPHIAFAEREKVNYDHPDAFDHDLLVAHLSELRQKKEIDIPIYDYSTHLRSNRTRTVGGTNIIVLEGILIYSYRPIRKCLDIRIFMDTPADICFIRRLQRDIETRNRSLKSVIEQYEKTVRPMYLQFIEPSKHYADVIVPRGGANRIAIDMIKAKIREMM